MNAADARRYLRTQRHGVLSTLSLNPAIAGVPCGSVVPYVTDHAGGPFFLVSALAEHTKNLRADARASLTVFDAPGNGDVQAGARLTVAGKITPVADDDRLLARYLRYRPSAARLVALGDFTLYRLQTHAVHCIGGFGDIHWFSAAEFAPPDSALADAEKDILAHMNADHAHNLREYCRHVYDRTAAAPVITGIDSDGFDVLADGELLRFPFDPPVTDAAGARAALIALLVTFREVARRAPPTSGD